MRRCRWHSGHLCFALNGDPLRIKVRLGQVAGKRCADSNDEGDRSDHPGQPTAMPPRCFEELRPQVQRQREEERFGAP